MIDDLLKLSRLIEKEEFLRGVIQCQSIAEISYLNSTYPILSFVIGSKDPAHPVLFITGGVHGLERIGAQLAWSLLKTTVDRLLWDKALNELFKNIRLVFVPLVNPVGYVHSYRSNGDGVDLMRNSPVNAIDTVPFLLGGHRYSNKLPWYRGEINKMADENLALVSFFKQQAFASECVISLDFHSGFGMKYRLWFPFSYTAAPFQNLPEMHALTQLFEETHPYHIYQIEPQSMGYLLNGDIWDYLFLEFKNQNESVPFLPVTLEMGSWTWVRKNPLQLFSRRGAFNPIKEHRVKRTYRRHYLLFDFLLKALYSKNVWACLDPGIRHKHQQLGLERWYVE